MTHTERKTALRARAMARRRARSEEERARDSRAVCALIESSAVFAEADYVLLYAPVHGELDLSPLAAAAAERRIPIGYPRVAGNGHMTYHTVADPAALVPGAFGIPAPAEEAPAIHPTDKTLLLIPALMGDGAGYRLGYGGGYFDRFLPTFPGRGVLVLPADEIVPCLPVEENDVAVPYLITPAGWYHGA